MRMRKVKLGEIRCSPVKDHHLHSLAQIQEPSWIQPPGLPWLVKSLLYPPRKLFCSDSSHHDGACQSTLMVMLKGRGVRDVSLTCIYSDTQAGLWSLQHWKHDDSTEGMCPGEKGGLQTEGGRPQVQNLPTLSKKDVTTGGKVFSRPSPRHHSHSKYTRCYCFPALDLLFLRVLLSGIRRKCGFYSYCPPTNHPLLSENISPQIWYLPEASPDTDISIPFLLCPQIQLLWDTLWIWVLY